MSSRLNALTCFTSLLNPAGTQVVVHMGKAAHGFVMMTVITSKIFNFDISAVLRQGPEMLYFFSKTFAKLHTGCVRLLRNAAALGTQGIGTLRRFPTEDYYDRFAIGFDPQLCVIRACNAAVTANTQCVSRIFCTTDKGGRIAFVHVGTDPLECAWQSQLRQGVPQ